MANMLHSLGGILIISWVCVVAYLSSGEKQPNVPPLLQISLCTGKSPGATLKVAPC